MAKWRDIPATWTAVPLILLFWALALTSMVWDSPTMDEQNHLARGLAFLKTGDPRLSLEHPPLVNSLSALPLLTLPNIQLPFDQPSWTEQEPAGLYWYFFADALLWETNQDVNRMIFLARMPILLLLLALGLVGFHFARTLWGRPAALPALFFLLFEPNLLAHGRLTTTDLGGTFFVFLATFFLWRLWQEETWSWPRWVWFALALGCAFGSKLSALAFLPIFAVTALLPLGHGRYGPATLKRLSQLFTAGLATLLIIWAIFGFQWGTFHFQSETLATLNHRPGPMPTFWAGIEQILLLSGGGRSSFLLGQYSDSGFLAYFPLAFLVKTPLALLIALPLAVLLLLPKKRTRLKAAYLLVPAILYFLLSMQSGLNIGYRHLLPILPFLLILISGLATAGSARRRWPQYAIAGLAAILFLETLTIHPHYLSFFNVAAGGPDNGRHILIDSNIDWGQDLRRLAQWLQENEVDAIKLGWFGTARPEYYGINYEPLPGLGGVGQPAFFDAWWQQPFDPANPEPGLYVISATSLGEFPLEEKGVYAYFRAREPEAQIGHSILIYEVSR